MLLRLVKSLSTATTTVNHHHHHHLLRRLSTTTKPPINDDDWNLAWETAWLPPTTPPPLPFPEPEPLPLPSELDPETDPETKAFISDMTDNWDTRRGKPGPINANSDDGEAKKEEKGSGLYSLESIQRDYRLKKQRIHAGLWVKEIDKLEESNLGVIGDANDIDKLLDSCSEIFDTTSSDVNNPKIPSTSEFKNKPDGWEVTSKAEDGSVWEMSQREEDILLQEFERRMAFCKFRIASFIKTHIFSRRRPVDGWKFMIEVIGPNANSGRGSAPKGPSEADPATQPFLEQKRPGFGEKRPGGRERHTVSRRR